MAGTIVANTLNTDTGVFSTNNAYTGIAVAWVYFGGISSVTINASFNVSSVTRNATGDYTVNFATALPDANYAVAGMASRNTATTSTSYLGMSPSTTHTTTAFEFFNSNDGGALEDAARCAVIVHR